jgi:hypothetical protein
MVSLVPSHVHPKGDQNIELSQEPTGELSAAMKGVHDGGFESLAVDRDGNLMDYSGRELLEQMLLELQKLNTQLSMITDHEISESDTR